MLVENLSQGRVVFNHLFSKKWVAVDTETVSRNPDKPEDALIYNRMKIKVFSMCYRGESYSFPTNVVAPEFPSMSEWAKLLVPHFENKKCIKVAHNWNYDFNVFYNAGLKRINPIWDTMVACWLAQEYLEKGLKSRAPLYSRLLRQTSSVDFNNLEELAEYAEQDVVMTDEIYQTQVYGKFTRPKLILYFDTNCKRVKTVNPFSAETVEVKEETLSDYEKVFLKIHEFPILKTVFRSTRYGMYLDLAQLKKTRQLMLKDKQEIMKRIFRYFGKVINLNSVKMLTDELNKKKITSPKQTAKGNQSFGAEALITLKAGGIDPSNIISDLLSYKAVSKLESVYIGDGVKTFGLEKFVNLDTSTIHSSLNSVGAVTGRSSSSNPNCYTGDTEYLTPSGWIRADSWNGQQVAQYDPITTKITFVLPSNFIENKSSTRRITNQHISLSVSDNHRCLFKDRKTGAIIEKPATSFAKDALHLNAGVYTGNFVVSASLVKLAVMIQADGSYYDSFVEFCWKRQRKIDRAVLLFDKIGIHYSKSIKKSGAYRFVLRYKDIPKEVWSLVDIKSKEFKWEIIHLKNLDVFCEELRYWDGSITGTEYCSKSVKCADIVQSALSLQGIRALKSRSYTDGKLYWRIRITPRDYSMTANAVIVKTGIKKVYCVEVPSSWLVIRHNGRVSISGNCQQIPSRKDIYQLKKNFKARPRYKGRKRGLVVLDQSQLEIRVMGIRCGDPRLLKILSDPKGDIHTETANTFGVDRSPTAKQLNFLMLYGGEAYMLSNKLTLEGVPTTMGQAAQYKNVYDETYYRVRAWREEMLEVHRTQGFCHYLTGRTRTLNADEITKKPINWNNKRDVHKAETTISNNLIQGDGQDFIKAAIIRLNHRLPNYDKYVLERFSNLDKAHTLRLKKYIPILEKARSVLKKTNTEFLLQVHDELKYETDLDDAEEVATYIAQIMTWRHYIPRCTVAYAVPLAVEGGIAETWYDAKGKNPLKAIHYFGEAD